MRARGFQGVLDPLADFLSPFLCSATKKWHQTGIARRAAVRASVEEIVQNFCRLRRGRQDFLLSTPTYAHTARLRRALSGLLFMPLLCHSTKKWPRKGTKGSNTPWHLASLFALAYLPLVVAMWREMHKKIFVFLLYPFCRAAMPREVPEGTAGLVSWLLLVE